MRTLIHRSLAWRSYPARATTSSVTIPGSGGPTYPPTPRVKYEAVYPGVDLVYYGTQGRQLEYDFVVAAGADPRQIKLSFAGVDKLELDAQGDLLIQSGERQMRMHKPVVYQEKDGAREEIAGQYTLSDEREVGFDIASL